MSARPHCREPEACKAKTPGKHCRGCTLSACWSQPGFREAHHAGCMAKLTNDPDYRARHDAAGSSSLARWRQEHPDAFAAVSQANGQRAASPAGRQATSEAKLGWCPRHLRPQYRELVSRKGIRAAEARRMIEAELPGTQAHAARQVENARLAGRIKHEREKAQRY